MDRAVVILGGVACTFGAILLSQCASKPSKSPSLIAAEQATLDALGDPPSPSCTKPDQLAAINYDTPSYQCSRPGLGASAVLRFDNVEMTLGRSVNNVVADARKAGAKIARGSVTIIEFVTMRPATVGDPYPERRTYRLSSTEGKITGITACESYQSGDNRHRTSTAMVAAYGAPAQVSQGVNEASMTWSGNQSLTVSGAPNVIRARIGDTPYSAIPSDDDGYQRIFDEVVREEDRHPGSPDIARGIVAMRYCATTQELDSVMVAMLKHGAQPSD